MLSKLINAITLHVIPL